MLKDINWIKFQKLIIGNLFFLVLALFFVGKQAILNLDEFYLNLIFTGVVFFSSLILVLFFRHLTEFIVFSVVLGIVFGVIIQEFNLDNWKSLAIFVSIYFLILSSIIFDSRIIKGKKEKTLEKKDDDEPLLISDLEIESSAEDEFGYKDQAEKFANDILNNGFDDPIVFGLDAPWGSGKSSFLNLCKEEWNKYDNVIVFDFKPARYDLSNHNVLKIFTDEFLKKLEEEGSGSFILRWNLNKYLMSVKKFSFFGFEIDLSGFSRQSTESIWEDIKEDIKNLDVKKIIVILDDLDRLYLNELKDVLNMVRNVFPINKMSFVLCYDTQNINTFESEHSTVHQNEYGIESAKKEKELNKYSRAERQLNNQKINEYFEKIVQVKQTLIPDKEKLKQYFLDKITEICQGITKNPKEVSSSTVNYFFNGDNYPIYQSYVGDLRKIKRILNFIKLLDLNTLFSEDSDVYPAHIVQLIILYLNFPHIIRKVYIEEVEGDEGFFSCQYTDNGFKNRPSYKSYLATLSEKERILVNDIFRCDTQDLKNRSAGKIYSGFKSDGNKMLLAIQEDLEDYLKIIFDRYIRKELGYYDNFHFQRARELETKSVEEIFNEYPETYGVKEGEKWRDKFFKVIPETPISLEATEKVIEYITDNIHKYSYIDAFSSSYSGIRRRLLQHLLSLLNNGLYNEQSIIEKILGKEGGSDPDSIFNKLLNIEHNPILAIDDALSFIINCDIKLLRKRYDLAYSVRVDNINEFTKVESAIDAFNKDKTQGKFEEELVSRLFNFFNKNFIEKNLNYFRELEKLSDDVFFGDFLYPINKSLDQSKVKNFIKNDFKSDIAIWLASESQESFGKYNNDDEKINYIIRQYLFNTCFKIEDSNIKNSEYFIDFLMALFECNYMRGRGIKCVFKINRIYKVLGEDNLKKYWRKNGEKIKEYVKKLPKETEIIRTRYMVTYKEHLSDVLNQLDAMLDDNTSVNNELI